MIGSDVEAPLTLCVYCTRPPLVLTAPPALALAPPALSKPLLDASMKEGCSSMLDGCGCSQRDVIIATWRAARPEAPV